jgi:hypothetical protein
MDADAIVASWSHDWRDALPTRPPAEQSALLAETRRAVARLQEAARAGGKAGRALHRKGLVETAGATLEVSNTLPAPLRIGPFLPNTVWPAVVRLSSAFPVARADGVSDQRGLAVHIVDHERRLDLLATTGEAHHARDARAMIASLDAAAIAVRGGITARLTALGSLIGAIGLRDALRLTRTVTQAGDSGVSLAALTFFSRSPFQLGEFAVRYRFAPTVAAGEAIREVGPDALAADLRERLARGPVRWSFEVQGYLDRERTPMDDHRIAWRSPWVQIATLSVRDAGTAPIPMALRHAPTWPVSNGPVLEPLGDLNMLRGAAYEVSQRGR